MLVPPPGAVSMRSSPSTRERRCLIPASPRLGRLVFGLDRNQRHCPRTASSSLPPTARSSTSTKLAPEWRATLRSASCATLYRHRDRAWVGSSTLSVALEARGNSLYGAESRALGLQRLDQSEVFENSGMQRIGQRVHVFTELDQVVTYRTHRLASDRIAQSLLLLSRINRKQSQALGDVIVQRMRQSGALVLVSGDQASVQVASFVFSAPTFSDIDRYGAQLSGLAILIEFNPPPSRRSNARSNPATSLDIPFRIGRRLRAPRGPPGAATRGRRDARRP